MAMELSAPSRLVIIEKTVRVFRISEGPSDYGDLEIV